MKRFKDVFEAEAPGFPKTLPDAYAIADHIAGHSATHVNHEQMVEYFRGAKADLKHTPLSEITPGDNDTNQPSATRQKKYAKMNPVTRPPIVVEGGKVVDGHHRYRDAVQRNESHMWAYHVTDA